MSWRRLHARVEDKLAQVVAGALGKARLRAAGVELSPRARIMGSPIVGRCEGSRIVIEDEVVLCSRSRWTALGVMHPVVLRTLRAGALLRIGGGTGISGGSFCAAVEVQIGARCQIGADVMVTDTDFHALSAADRERGWDGIACAPVRIGNDVFIGARAVILKGVQIGDGAVIGAGAVVTRSVPAFSVAAGNPAVVVRSLPALAAA
jgi:acetyltransferase-like isoleucine patch superfamily enzyme